MTEKRTTDLARVHPEIIAVRRKLDEPETLALIKRTWFGGASDDELAVCIQQAKHLGLDPFLRQIYFVPDPKRRSIITMVGIDGLRLAAERTGLYAGQTAPQWCGPDGVWRDVWLGDGPPSACRLSVRRKDWDEVLPSTVKYASFVRRTREGRPIAQWATMPDHMLAKCCEAQGLRRAFPRELSGDYEVAGLEAPSMSRAFNVRDDTPALTDGEDPVALLIGAMSEAPNLKALSELAAQFKGVELTHDQKTAAREAYDAATDRLTGKTELPREAVAVGETTTVDAKDLPGQHDYGPPAMTDAEVAAVETGAQGGFGFGESDADNG